MPSILQEVQVPIIENQVCQDMFETAGHTKTILSSFLCAGYANGQRDSCEVYFRNNNIRRRDNKISILYIVFSILFDMFVHGHSYCTFLNVAICL